MIEKTWFHHIPPSESVPVMILRGISHTVSAMGIGESRTARQKWRWIAVPKSLAHRAAVRCKWTQELVLPRRGFELKANRGLEGPVPKYWGARAAVLTCRHRFARRSGCSHSGLRLKWIYLHRFPMFSHADARTSLRDLISADSPQGHSCWPQVPDTIAAWHLQVALCDPNVMGGCFELRFHEEDDSWTLQLWSALASNSQRIIVYIHSHRGT